MTTDIVSAEGKASSLSSALAESESNDTSPLGKSSTLVMKNIPFTLRKEKLLDNLNEYDVKPRGVAYHYDASGSFRGMAFVRYASPAEAQQALDLFSGLDISGRKVRVEFKRTRQVNGGEVIDEDLKKMHGQLMRYKEDTAAADLAFPMTLTTHQRKQLHQMAEKLGLVHESVGDGEHRHIIISRRNDNGDSPKGMAIPASETRRRSRSNNKAASSWGSLGASPGSLTPSEGSWSGRSRTGSYTGSYSRNPARSWGGRANTPKTEESLSASYSTAIRPRSLSNYGRDGPPPAIQPCRQPIAPPDNTAVGFPPEFQVRRRLTIAAAKVLASAPSSASSTASPAPALMSTSPTKSKPLSHLSLAFTPRSQLPTNPSVVGNTATSTASTINDAIAN